MVRCTLFLLLPMHMCTKSHVATSTATHVSSSEVIGSTKKRPLSRRLFLTRLCTKQVAWPGIQTPRLLLSYVRTS